jgi:hypothetical protein
VEAHICSRPGEGRAVERSHLAQLALTRTIRPEGPINLHQIGPSGALLSYEDYSIKVQDTRQKY